jgi:DNA-binding transcriptional regulator YiaG
MKTIVYEGLGFPVRLAGVKTRVFRGEKLPDINHRQLEDLAFRALLWAPMRLSGAQLAFIRGYMQNSQKEFASLLGMKSHATVSAWENKGNKETGMPSASEILVRLLMADFIKDAAFAPEFKKFLALSASAHELQLKVA